MKIETGCRTAEADKQVLERKIRILNRSVGYLKEEGQEIPKELSDLIEDLEAKLKLLE